MLSLAGSGDATARTHSLRSLRRALRAPPPRLSYVDVDIRWLPSLPALPAGARDPKVKLLSVAFIPNTRAVDLFRSPHFTSTLTVMREQLATALPPCIDGV